MKQYLVIANPPYDKQKTHYKILKLFKEKYPCVFVMSFHHDEEDKSVCETINHFRLFSSIHIVSRICIVGYNVRKQCGGLLDRVIDKYVEHLTDVLNDHLNIEKPYRLYLRRMKSSLHEGRVIYRNQDRHQKTSPYVSFDTKEEREQWKKLYENIVFSRLLYIIQKNIMYIDFRRMAYFKPGTTLDDVKQHFHLTDEEIKALEDYA